MYKRQGISLRKYGIRGEILILGYTDIHRASELKKYNLTQTLIDYEYANALNKQGVNIKAHIKIDTGMHRLGVSYSDFNAVKNIFTLKNIKINGIYTHLCCSDSLHPDDITFTRDQINKFYHLIDILKNNGITIPRLHIQSSFGLMNYPSLKCDYVRVGIALYGVLSSPNNDNILKLNLRPVLSLKSKVVLIRTIQKGDSVGYGRNFTAPQDSKIAIVPIGYADGFPRILSCRKNMVKINEQLVPIIGHICMDQLIIDITNSKNIVVGDTVTLIDSELCNNLNAPNIADHASSISNELLCRMGTRLTIVSKY